MPVVSHVAAGFGEFGEFGEFFLPMTINSSSNKLMFVKLVRNYVTQ